MPGQVGYYNGTLLTEDSEFNLIGCAVALVWKDVDDIIPAVLRLQGRQGQVATGVVHGHSSLVSFVHAHRAGTHGDDSNRFILPVAETPGYVGERWVVDRGL